MKQRDKVEGRRRLIEDLKAKQRNTVWPDPLINSRGVDAFLWKGSPNPSMVQRIGAVLFGLFFICGAVMFASICAERHSLWGILAFVFLYAGAKVLRNSWPRDAPKRP